MRYTLQFLWLILLFASLMAFNDSATAIRQTAESAPAETSPLDPEIARMLEQVEESRIATSIQTLANFRTRNTCSDDNAGTSAIGGARDWLMSQLAAIPGLHVTLDPFTHVGCGGVPVTRHNVIAWIAGTLHPDRLIVIGGHYDSRTILSTDGTSPAPGANDSGSQAALVLEAARVMAGHSYDATVIFAVWAGEEQGLHGSAAFIDHYRTYFPTGTLELNLTCDIVGGDNTVNDAAALQQFRLYSPGTPREVSAMDGSTDNTSPSRGLMRYTAYWAGAYVPEMSMVPELREDRVGRGSDHKSFIARGIPAVRFIDTKEALAHQHNSDDQYQYVTPHYTARVAQVMIATAASLARAPMPPQSFVARQVSASKVKLWWTAPASGAAVDHYVISARTTDENFYRARFLIGSDASSAKVKISAGLEIPIGASFFISLAAVDADGHESLYAYPEYRCESGECAVPQGALDVIATR
jgi:hypothetical protein